MKKIYLILMVSSLLGGCERQHHYTATYLKQHPIVLHQELDDCQNKAIASVEYCQLVRAAADDILPIITNAQENPEEFGQRILDTQMAAAKAKQAIGEAQQKLELVEKQQPGDVQNAKENVERAKQQYHDLHEQTLILLGIAGLNNPE